jgi:transcriptional regulator with XRE-family HTH domain
MGETEASLKGVRLALALKRDELGGQTAMAKAAGVSPQFVSDAMRGKRNPTGNLLKLIGYERVVVYRKV